MVETGCFVCCSPDGRLSTAPDAARTASARIAKLDAGAIMSNSSGFTLAYKILSWSSFVGLILVVILVLHRSPAPNVPYDKAASARVDQKFAAADQAKAAGQPSQVQLDRTEVNSVIQDNLAANAQAQPANTAPPAAPAAAPANQATPIPDGTDPNNPLAALEGNDPQSIEQMQSAVKDVKVDMDGDLVKAYVIFDFHGKDLSLELDGHLGTQNGYVNFVPVAGKLGSLPLPQSALNAAMQKIMASPEAREKMKLPNDISDIQIVNGQAVVKYKDQ